MEIGHGVSLMLTGWCSQKQVDGTDTEFAVNVAMQVDH